MLSTLDLTREDFERLFCSAESLRGILRGASFSLAKNRFVALAFFEPSTRTRISFEIATKKIGGEVVDLGEVERTSIVKGETLVDTVRMLDGYGVNVIVLRHPNDGAARLAAEVAEAPVISAGDGAREHPTQALLDVYTIWRELGRVDGIHVGMMGDLKYGRTTSSLSYALSKFNGVRVTYIAPEPLQVREEVVRRVRGRLTVSYAEDVSEIIEDLDVLYVTRLQKERLPDPRMCERLWRLYVLRKDLLKRAKEGLIVLHPLPRVDELDTEIDSMRFARYFEQASNGVVARAALLKEVLGV